MLHGLYKKPTAVSVHGHGVSGPTFLSPQLLHGLANIAVSTAPPPSVPTLLSPQLLHGLGQYSSFHGSFEQVFTTVSGKVYIPMKQVILRHLSRVVRCRLKPYEVSGSIPASLSGSWDKHEYHRQNMCSPFSSLFCGSRYHLLLFSELFQSWFFVLRKNSTHVVF